MLLPRQAVPVGYPRERAAFVLACLCVHPPPKHCISSSVCTSQLGPVPSGEFPTPVHLSLRSWTGCFCQLLRGPARPAPSSSQGKRAACPSASPHLNLYLSIAPEQAGVGTLYPEREGATSSTGRWSIFVGVSSLLCAVSVWSWV